ncbi:MAG: polysaccharide biosynthesis protein [Oscillospiraceae bacterium]
MKNRVGKNHRFIRHIAVGILDALCIIISFYFALWACFDFDVSQIPSHYSATYLHTIPAWTVVSLAVFALFGMYDSIWRYVGVKDLERILIAHIVLAAIGALSLAILHVEMPSGYYCLGFVLSFFAVMIVHFSYRFFCQLYWEHRGTGPNGKLENTMIIGAGAAGRELIRECNMNPALHKRVVCVIDDNASKWGSRIEGAKIVGGRDDIPAAAKKYHVYQIVYAIPSAGAQTRKEILSQCSTTGCEIQVVPGISQLVNGEVSVSSLREVRIQDLLGREPIRVNMDEIYHYISGKVVMVTGGGGSIGSELCRQIAKSNPKLLLIFDIYENNAYDIQQELKRTCPELNQLVLIGSVRNAERLEWIMEKYRPDILFHAAAHKHVPLMEDSPNEAIKNNVFGTYKTAKAAVKYGVKKFVLISTDKAVNPTNIMGASKRLCEMVVQMMDRQSETEFVAVRFGNVLGSNGSVIPLFEKQIAEGGPVTVTHPEITRFFMTISEAVSLVLQAGYYAKGGEIFILDMGEPVKIDDMARNLIRLSGYTPDVDIPIVYTGLRPGEKLYEELLMAEEGLRKTDNKLLYIGRPIEMDDELFQQQLHSLETICETEAENIKQLVAEMVPTYKPEIGG